VGRNEQTPQATNVLVVSNELAAAMLEVLAGGRPLLHETAPTDSEKNNAFRDPKHTANSRRRRERVAKLYR